MPCLWCLPRPRAEGSPIKLTYNDAQHAYWLDGKRCKSVSTVAKIPDDTYSLNQWAKRQILVGVAIKPDLAERAAAHFDDRDTLDRMAEEALQAAKAHDAANRGTAIHRITERVDLGEFIIDNPQARKVRAAWQRALDIAGLEIVPELVERIVVYPEQRIAGRFDRIARRKGDGRLCVCDIKTGANAVKYPHAVAVQLALYAHAPLMAGPIGREGGATEVFEALPDLLDRSVGYVIHMPTEDEVDVVAVDLEAGWEAAGICFATLGWRARRDLLIPVTEVAVAEVAEVAPAEAPVDRSAWIAGRLAVIAAHSPEAKNKAAAVWPAGVPTRAPWTDEQIDMLDTALATVEAFIEAPFPAADPARPAPPTTVETPVDKVPALPDKPGDTTLVSDIEFEKIRQIIGGLPDDQRNRLRVWSTEGVRAQRPWTGNRDGMYRRQHAITLAAVACVAHLDEPAVRNLCAGMLGIESLHACWTTGAALGCLSEAQAAALADLALRAGVAA